MDQQPFLRDLGRGIASRRRAAGLTQEQVAERIGSSAEWISQVERGIGQPSVVTLRNLAGVFGVTVGDLFLGVETPQPMRPEILILMERAGGLPDASVRVLVALAEALERELPGG